MGAPAVCDLSLCPKWHTLHLFPLWLRAVVVGARAAV